MLGQISVCGIKHQVWGKVFNHTVDDSEKVDSNSL